MAANASFTPTRYTLTFYVPTTSTKSVLAACFTSGAGKYPGGLYSDAAFVGTGTGQFRPNAGANPNIGTVGEMEYVEENKVEMICVGEDVMKKAVEKLKDAHPYEVVPYQVYKMEDI